MINKHYVSFIRIPLVKTKAGNFFTDELWAKDLLLHLDYLSKFSLCCPIICHEKTEELVDISDYNIKNIYELKPDGNVLSVLKNIIPNFLVVIRAVKEADIVHSDCSGWAFPLSFYILFLRPFFSFQWVIVMESSFWMLHKDQVFSYRTFFEHWVYKLILTKCLKLADARIFTQSYYREVLLKTETDRTLINPATWIDENSFTSVEAIKRRYEQRKGKVLELLFPARLITDKGVNQLLTATHLLQEQGVYVNITIIGLGPLAEKCQSYAKQNYGSVKLMYLSPVKYGEDFFYLLNNYDVVLVLNLKEEQPRIIFDAFSQGLGILGFNTSGIRDCITPGENALICESNTALCLAQAISYLVNHPQECFRMGLNGFYTSQGKTHLQMHKDREVFLKKVLNKG